MFEIGDVFFCREVVLNQDGTPAVFVDRFSRLKAEYYPYRFDFAVSIIFVHSAPVNGFLMFRISKIGKLVYKTAPRPIYFAVPFESDHEDGLIVQLNKVVFPGPGKYWVEIYFDGHLEHREALMLENEVVK
jgi:hypothetical protein